MSIPSSFIGFGRSWEVTGADQDVLSQSLQVALLLIDGDLGFSWRCVAAQMPCRGRAAALTST